MCVCIFMYESKGVRRRNGRSMQSMTHAKTGNISINILTVTLIIAILLHHLHNLSLTPVGAVFINWFYFNPITTDIIHFFLSSFPPPLTLSLLSFFPSFVQPNRICGGGLHCQEDRNAQETLSKPSEIGRTATSRPSSSRMDGRTRRRNCAHRSQISCNYTRTSIVFPFCPARGLETKFV